MATTNKKRLPHRKLGGASMLSNNAWLEIAAALTITKRELQIIQAVFDNLTKAAIAQRLGISANTTHTHLNRLFKKLNVTTRTELVLRITEQMVSLTLSETGVLPPICRHHHAGVAARKTHPPAPSSVTRNLPDHSRLCGRCRPNGRLFKLPQSARISTTRKRNPAAAESPRSPYENAH